MAECEACYVYVPDCQKGGDIEPRPSKRQRTKPVARSTPASDISFVPLLRGKESFQCVSLRLKTFESFWAPQEALLKGLIDSINITVVKQLVSFVSTDTLTSIGQIPTGLLIAGPGNAIPDRLIESVEEGISAQERTLLLRLTPGPCMNLKSILKTINQLAARQCDESSELIEPRNPQVPRRLNYDLAILQSYVDRFRIRRVLISIEDSEAFDGTLLSNLVELLALWQDRIPFVLFFGLATGVELFQEKLSSRATQCLQAKKFDMEHIDIERLFTAIQPHQPDTAGGHKRGSEGRKRPLLRIGPQLSKAILSRQRGKVQSPSAFIQTLKYAYMSHFFANSLSVLLGSNEDNTSSHKELAQAVRHLPSFKGYCEILLSRMEYDSVRRLLDDDEYVQLVVADQLAKCTETLDDMASSISLVFALQKILLKDQTPCSDIYIMAMSNQLRKSDILGAILSAIKNASSHSAVKILATILQTCDNLSAIVPLQENLQSVIGGFQGDKVNELRSGHDIQQKNLRTAVVARKVQLSRQATVLTNEEVQYTKILDQLQDILTSHFDQTLKNPKDLFPVEMLMYDSLSPHRDVFMPRPRFAVERALSRPQDYLGHETFQIANRMSSLNPAISICYEMYLECGSLINAADLWSAFWTVSDPQGEHEDVAKQEQLALYERTLAEMKYLGMLKHSRKKQDHLTKLSWKGL